LGKLAPGSPLRSNDLRRDYDVGISPLREALSRLVSEQLVTLSGQRGFRVAPISIEDVLDTMETRIVIDSEALARSIRSGGLTWETEVVSSFHTLSKTALPSDGGEPAEIWATRHRKFHLSLISGCGSHWMLTLSGSLFDHAERHRMITLKSTLKRQSAGEEHRRIMEAALAGNVKAAASAIDYHYRSTAELVVRCLEEVEVRKPAMP
jgi:DNA-binding GntR family transcriptional regulator